MAKTIESRAVGVDSGTAFFQTAEKNTDGTIKLQIIRNAFVEMFSSEDIEETLKKNGWNYIKDDDDFYIVGEDAIKVARMFPGKVEVRRPLQDGVLNKGEDKKLLVLDYLVNNTIGNAPDEFSVVTTCVSSLSADGAQDSEFHKKRLEAIFKGKKWNVKIIDEGFAIILAERPIYKETDGTESPYSGISISLGGGRVNCVLAYKGVQITGMSCARGGDYLDRMVSIDTGVPLSQCSNYKETKLDFDNLDMDNDVAFAYDAYYSAMIKYVLTHFEKKFKEVKSQFDNPLDVVVAGGTSMPKGFIKKFKEVINELKLPFKIGEVRHAKDPRNAVVEGCLFHAIASQKKLQKELAEKKKEEELKEIFDNK